MAAIAWAAIIEFGVAVHAGEGNPAANSLSFPASGAGASPNAAPQVLGIDPKFLPNDKAPQFSDAAIRNAVEEKNRSFDNDLKLVSPAETDTPMHGTLSVGVRLQDRGLNFRYRF